MKRIPLRAKDGSVRAYALVDDADFEWLSQWPWHFSMGYAMRKGGRKTVNMHRQILGLERGDRRQGEHKNRNPLDCRRSNLRIAERGQADNQQNRGAQVNNTSGYRGVFWSGKEQKWVANARVGGMRFCRCFETAELADIAVKAFRAQHMPFSEDARLAA